MGQLLLEAGGTGTQVNTIGTSEALRSIQEPKKEPAEGAVPSGESLFLKTSRTEEKVR